VAAARFIFLCGLPGSGKSTVARVLADELGAVRFCPDEWMTAVGIDLFDEPARARVEALQWELAQQLVLHGVTAIIEWGVWSRAERDAVRARARELGVPIELIFLDSPIDVLWKRVQRRNETGPPGTPIISREDLVAWSTIFEVPTAEELALFDPPEDE
jgi:predicted kinase